MNLSKIVPLFAVMLASLVYPVSASLAQTQAKQEANSRPAAKECVVVVEVVKLRPDGRLEIDAPPTRKAQDSTVPFYAGDPVWLKMTFRNVGTGDVSIVESASEDFKFKVYREQDGVKQKASFTAASGKFVEIYYDSEGSHVRGTLRPGDKLTRYCQISRLYDMSRAGTYFITVSRTFFGIGGETTATSPLMQVDQQDLPLIVKDLPKRAGGED